ncbi:DNA-binding response regulator [Candidatus Methylobacter favarea]|uniref:DNA-binding response regulator n=1 Tax=Candidatus Methylobacter favarea TaxID=2707345 RepID=A0A8S0YAI0_9GAMM|nr:response regulator transcription factor [Candidatus Methylobacter favarea]CAA9891927.1 DNA-binding response regulator [Candidatus Methylobacter favarea]
MSAAKSIRILLVDDHAIIREGYRSLLQKQPGMIVVAEAVDGAQAYRRFKEYSPDIVIMDISLPGQGGLQAIARIKQNATAAKILVFSMHQNPGFAVQAIHAGALGYVTKSSMPQVLIEAVQDVHAGRLTLSADIAQVLALETLGGDHKALQELSVREFEILRMLVEARSTDDIAQTLNLSPKTVSNCHYLIKRKLGVASDIELTHWAIRMKLINLLELSGPSSEYL